MVSTIVDGCWLIVYTIYIYIYIYTRVDPHIQCAEVSWNSRRLIESELRLCSVQGACKYRMSFAT